MRTILALIFLAAIPVMAQEPDSASALFDMLNAERGFAQSSVMHGRNASFAENFAEESVVFTNKWITNGKQFSKERKDAPVVLKWEPEFMDIAKSRDFGISTGPWEMQDYRPGTAPLATGYFLTVWKKQPDGTWQVILDRGSGTPARAVNNHRITFPAGADLPVNNVSIINPDLVAAEIAEREKQILLIWKINPVASTYSSFLAPDARLQVSGELPKIRNDSIAVRLNRLNKSLIWTTAGSRAATSGDMGFTFGTFETHGEAESSSGHYVRIWKKQADGKWLISLEMMNTDKVSPAAGQ